MHLLVVFVLFYAAEDGWNVTHFHGSITELPQPAVFFQLTLKPSRRTQRHW